ncbi:esterase/lipase family protein [Streptomyces monticola]|uniref:Esterase/lipase family protein n=1 Tax=Streptomyces monticola TaxID=2666263 RepID=A0ABW2JEL7_9ACTN
MPVRSLSRWVLPLSRWSRRATAVCAATAATAVLMTAPAAAVAGPAGKPADEPFGDKVAAAKKFETKNLPGVNDWSCKPSAAHPRPLVLVHGTFDAGRVWGETAKDYKKAGYCVFSLDYGKSGGLLSLVVGGIDSVAKSAKELAVFVDGVLQATGKKQVDIVGHSQGGMMPRQYMKFEGGKDKVRTLVGISPSSHGTGNSDFQESLIESNPDLEGLLESVKGMTDIIVGPIVDIPCPACNDQRMGSPFMKKLNAGGDTLPGVDYTVIATKKDSVVTRPKDQFLKPTEPSHKVKNILLQDVCPDNDARHPNSVSDPVATRLALNALDPEHAVKPTCPTLADRLKELLPF